MQEKAPTILVSDGWETDENDALAEIVIPSTVETYNVPQKVTFLGETLNWIPSTAAALQHLSTKATAIAQNLFNGYTQLVSLTLSDMISFSTTTTGQFTGCNKLESIQAPLLQEFVTAAPAAASVGAFRNCTKLSTLNFPKLKQIVASGPYISVNGPFRDCTGLMDVTLGSEGNAVLSINGAVFANCTQSGLTITIYTNGGAALSGAPWGATNATIVYEEA